AIRRLIVIHGPGPVPARCAAFRSRRVGGHPQGLPARGSGERKHSPSHWWIGPRGPHWTSRSSMFETTTGIELVEVITSIPSSLVGSHSRGCPPYSSATAAA